MTDHRQSRTCSECGTPLNNDAPEGFCPACMLEGALKLSPTENPKSEIHNFQRRFGDYELIDEIARGGMGIVYRAGDAPFDGIAIRNGATGVVKGNTITSHAYTGLGDAFSSGIAAYDDNAANTNRPAFAYVPLFPVRYEGNTFSNNDEHLVVIAANESQIVNNTFQGTGPSGPRWGGVAISGTNIVVANNNFSGMPTGIVLFGNDAFFNGWPSIRPAANPTLTANWFCNVIEPLSTHAGVTGVQERGTELCPFRPILQFIARDVAPSASVSLNVRGWHGQPMVIESSTDFQNWVPAYTNMMALPSFEVLGAASTEPHRFYRAVQR